MQQAIEAPADMTNPDTPDHGSQARRRNVRPGARFWENPHITPLALKGRPDITLACIEALPGSPSFGWVPRPDLPAGGYAFGALFAGLTDGPDASIRAIARADGPPIAALDGFDGLSVDEAERLLSGWRLAQEIYAGRPAGSTAITRAQWDDALSTVRPKHRRQDERVAAMARELYISRKTARRYVTQRGWPI